MSDILDPTNLSALQFNIEFADTMKQICGPILDKEIGIIDFVYCRIFNNGTRLYLGNVEWVEYYLNHGFHDNIEHIEFYVPGEEIKHALWSGFKDDPIFSAGRDVFNWGNGFNIYEYAGEHVEIFDFLAHKNNTQIVNYYLNNLCILNEKVKFFKEKASIVIDLTDKRKLMVSKKWRPFHEVPKNSLLSAEKERNFLRQTKRV